MIDFRVSEDAGATVLIIRNEYLTQENAGGLPAVIGDHFDPGKGFILDLTAVTFIDSSGLGAIVRAFKDKLMMEGITVRIAAKQVEKLFYITKLDRIFRIEMR